MNTKVKIAGVEFKNPVMTASGTFGSGMEYSDFVDLNRLGASFFKLSSGCFSFSIIFQFSCHIARPTVDISKFSTFFSFLAIFHILQWTLLNFPIFQFSSPYFMSFSVHFSFFTFFSDFVIFQIVM